jgi:regulator of replication initiation timing
MGKADRKLKRRNAAPSTKALTKQSVLELQKLPAHLEDIIKANEQLTDENERIKEVIGEVLEEHANKIASLEREVKALKGDQDDDEVHPSTT